MEVSHATHIDNRMGFAGETGRTVSLDVLREGKSLLPGERPKEVRIESKDQEMKVTLFFRPALTFEKGELLDFGPHLGGRDQKAVRKTVSGLIKLLHPNGEVNRGEMEEYVTYAMEMRRRVKEQLKKMGGLEYWDTSFSFADRESGQETFISVPEMGGGRLIVEGVLQPGSVYTIGTDATDNRLALFLVQSQMNRGSGRIIPLGHLSSKMKEAIKTADAYLKAHLKNLGIDHDLKAYDFTIQAINLNQAREGAETSVAFFISMVSIILGRSVQERTVILGEMSVQGMLLKVGSLPERMQLAVEAGARRILIPSENKRDLADVPDAILTAIQWQFYDSPTRAVILALGMR